MATTMTDSPSIHAETIHLCVVVGVSESSWSDGSLWLKKPSDQSPTRFLCSCVILHQLLPSTQTNPFASSRSSCTVSPHGSSIHVNLARSNDSSRPQEKFLGLTQNLHKLVRCRLHGYRPWTIGFSLRASHCIQGVFLIQSAQTLQSTLHHHSPPPTSIAATSAKSLCTTLSCPYTLPWYTLCSFVYNLAR